MASRIGFFFLLTTLTLAGHEALPAATALVGCLELVQCTLLPLAKTNANQLTSHTNYVIEKPFSSSSYFNAIVDEKSSLVPQISMSTTLQQITIAKYRNN